MCGEDARLSVVSMLNTTHIRPIIGAVLAALLLLVALSPSSGQAAGQTETLKFFSKPVSFIYTAADGTVTHGPPSGPPQAERHKAANAAQSLDRADIMGQPF